MPHPGRDPTVGSFCVPDLGRHIDVVVVESDPYLGELAGLAVLLGYRLDKLGDRRNAQVERLVEDPIDVERLVYTRGSQRGAGLAGLVDHRTADRRGRIVDLEPIGTTLLGHLCRQALERHQDHREGQELGSRHPAGGKKGASSSSNAGSRLAGSRPLQLADHVLVERGDLNYLLIGSNRLCAPPPPRRGTLGPPPASL